MLEYSSIRLAILMLRILPLRLRRFALRNLLRVVAHSLTRHRNIAQRNIGLAFPEMTQRQRRRLFVDSFASMGDLIVDLERFPRLSKQWAEERVHFPNLARLHEVKNENPQKGILLVAGHLGSFELSAYCLPFLYRPISFIVREFSNPYLNRWWKSYRQSNGNTAVSRRGGYRKMLRLLRSGEDVGVLFDQNVTRTNALFVKWFGKEAATTKALANAALGTKAPIFIIAIIRQGVDQYLYECIECSCADIYDAKSVSKDMKLVMITERLVQEYEKLIVKYPQSWFWIHRKWKTAPEGQVENFYEGC